MEAGKLYMFMWSMNVEIGTDLLCVFQQWCFECDYGRWNGMHSCESVPVQNRIGRSQDGS
jgi:hypothetical protein